MAANKFYSYYLRGGQIALIEQDINDNNKWKSPASTIADGLEIEYAYSPRYSIDETEDVNTAIDTYVSLDGLLKIIDQGDDDYSASPESLSDGSFIVLRKAGRWNGLHKVKEAGVGYITTYTKFSGSATVQKTFERTPDLYYNVDVLNDEADELPVSEHLSKAIVYYVKAKLAEDAGQIDLKEYNMKEFYRLAHKSKTSREYGPTMVIPGSHAIR